MILDFRQGIVRYAVDNKSLSTFLYTDKNTQYVSFNAQYNKVLLAFAHENVDYLYEESTDTKNAFGPFDKNTKYWLYLDLNTLTGFRTFGSTKLEPIVSDIEPTKIIDQHWYNTSNNTMYCYDGLVWIQKLRVFVGTYNNHNVTILPHGTQVENYEHCNAGYILYDDADSPSKRASTDGSYKFLTTTSHFAASKSVTTTVSLEQSIRIGQASVNLSKYKMVTYAGDNIITTASYDDPDQKTAIGVVEYDVNTGEKCYFSTNTYLTNSAWNFTAPPSSSIYLGLNGNITTTIPSSGFIQKIGFVVSPNTVYIDTTYQIIYFDEFKSVQPVAVGLNLATGTINTESGISDDNTSTIKFRVYGSSYIQPVPNEVWVLKHHHFLQNFLVQTYDEYGYVMYPDNIIKFNDTTVEVSFTKRVAGTAQLFLF
jgi:hypothetical protein